LFDQFEFKLAQTRFGFRRSGVYHNHVLIHRKTISRQTVILSHEKPTGGGFAFLKVMKPEFIFSFSSSFSFKSSRSSSSSPSSLFLFLARFQTTTMTLFKSSSTWIIKLSGVRTKCSCRSVQTLTHLRNITHVLLADRLVTFFKSPTLSPLTLLLSIQGGEHPILKFTTPGENR
jgi:hypothetical protein